MKNLLLDPQKEKLLILILILSPLQKILKMKQKNYDSEGFEDDLVLNAVMGYWGQTQMKG